MFGWNWLLSWCSLHCTDAVNSTHLVFIKINFKSLFFDHMNWKIGIKFTGVLAAWLYGAHARVIQSLLCLKRHWQLRHSEDKPQKSFCFFSTKRFIFHQLNVLEENFLLIPMATMFCFCIYIYIKKGFNFNIFRKYFVVILESVFTKRHIFWSTFWEINGSVHCCFKSSLKYFFPLVKCCQNPILLFVNVCRSYSMCTKDFVGNVFIHVWHSCISFPYLHL